MNVIHACTTPRDSGYSNVCQICGIPADAGYFDVADITAAPEPGKEVELARYELHPQSCGVLFYFAQYAEPKEPQNKEVFKTPGYEWVILCNNQPRAPYLPTNLILNPWGYNAFPIHLRLEEGCTVRFVVRKVPYRPDGLKKTTLQAKIGAGDAFIPASDPLASWPTKGHLRISLGSSEELVEYIGIDKTASPHKFTGASRGLGDTTPQPWSAGASIELVEPEIKLSQVGGRLLGRYWYNLIYGGVPNRL